MLTVNEQLDKLWNGDIPEETNRTANSLKKGLVAFEKEAGVENAGSHQTRNGKKVK